MLALAIQEWDYFGRQEVVYQDTEESIPHVGIWEDDDLGRLPATDAATTVVSGHREPVVIPTSP